MPTLRMTFEIDGSRFSTLEGFYAEVSRVLVPAYDWGRNLDAFNDILRGGLGTPEDGFRLIWRNSGKSLQDLGYDETVRQLALRLEHCHPESRKRVASQLSKAQRFEGPTAFEWLVEIIQSHDDIELVLA